MGVPLHGTIITLHLLSLSLYLLQSLYITISEQQCIIVVLNVGYSWAKH